MPLGKWHLPATEDDWPADSEARRLAGLAAAGALCQQRQIISDWGDFNGDYGAAEHAAANQRIGDRPPGGADVHCSTIEEVEAFYDSCRSEGIRICHD